MKTPQEILGKYLPNRTGYPVEALEDEIVEAMKEYAKLYHNSKVKKLGLPAVTNAVCDTEIWIESKKSFCCKTCKKPL